MSPKLAPFLVPKTVTSCSSGLPKRGPKTRAFFVTEIGTAGGAPTQLHSNVCLAGAYRSQPLGGCHDDHAVVSMRAQAHASHPLQQCVSGALVRRITLSIIGWTRITCLDVPSSWQNRVPNMSASQVLRVRLKQARNVCDRWAPQVVLGALFKRATDTPRSQGSVARASKLLLAHMIKNTLEHGARAHSLCTHSGNCERHGLIRKCGAQLCARHPPRESLACRLLGDRRVGVWTLRSTERRCCAWVALCAPQR